MSMLPIEPRILDIESLAHGIPVLQPAMVAFYKQNCMVCFDSEHHVSGVRLEHYQNDDLHLFEVRWHGQVTEHLRRSYRDQNKTTDFAACAIALLLVRELTEYQAIEQSAVGTTIDYYLIPNDQHDDTLIFNHSAYLEVSGIRHETSTNTVAGRIKEKIQRLNTSEDLPVLIAIVEFSRPWSKMVTV